MARALRQKLQFLEASQEKPDGYSAERRDPQLQAAGEKDEASPSSLSTFFAELKDEGSGPEGPPDEEPPLVGSPAARGSLPSPELSPP